MHCIRHSVWQVATLPPPPPSNLKPDIASHPIFNFPLFEIKWYVKHALPWMQNPTMHIEVSEASNFRSAQVVSAEYSERKADPPKRCFQWKVSSVSFRALAYSPAPNSFFCIERMCLLHFCLICYQESYFFFPPWNVSRGSSPWLEASLKKNSQAVNPKG